MPRRLAALWCAMGVSAALAAPVLVEVPSLDRAQGAPVVLSGHWFPVEGAERRPAVVLLHGCGGLLDGKGRLGARQIEYAALLNAEGWHALALDSLTSRGVKELCTMKAGQRPVTQAHRRLDALGALQWLAAQQGVDATRLVLLGWSNGGSTVLAATNRTHRAVGGAGVKPRAAVAFYPGCEAELARGYASVSPTLLLVGASDDWTLAQPCVALAATAGSGARAVVYDGAHHGFDGTAPLRHRADVPGGAKPGQGVTVGGQPAAREASRREMLAFLREQLR
jgi:dienelactone hydrolase